MACVRSSRAVLWVLKWVAMVDYYDKSPTKEVLGMFRSRTCRMCGQGYVAVFSLSDLVLDRSRKPVDLQSPAACGTRAVGDSNPNY